MYSPEHVAKVYIFVFVHNSWNMFFSIFACLFDVNQSEASKICRFLFLVYKKIVKEGIPFT